jgi:CheY-like chemotaxis protein
MPGMSGIELARQASAHLPDIKILLTSGYAASALEKHGEGAMQYGVINKPYRLSDIIKQLKALH